MNVQQLGNRTTAIRTVVSHMDARLEAENSHIGRMRGQIAQLEEEKKELVKAVGLIDRCITIISANGIGKIESIVTGGLRLVFNDPKMALVVEKKETARGNSYRLIVKQGNTQGDAMDTFGGGIVNVVGFLLRVIMIKRFKQAKFIALDEQLLGVSKKKGYLVRVSQMLHKLAKEHGYTIFAITHEPRLAKAADHVYEVFARVQCKVCDEVFNLPNDEEDTPITLCPKCGSMEAKQFDELPPVLVKLKREEMDETGLQSADPAQIAG